ncbi:MAG: PD-(D/E)XK nuclease family protein [Terracidiphilus sp.]
MEPSRLAQIDDWIRGGGIVVTASERAARSLQMAYHHRRRVEGLMAWPAPSVQAWTSFVSAAWEQFARDERMLLNSAQDQALWAEIIGREQHIVTALEAPRQRLASLAMRAHELLCSFAPRYLNESARGAWDNDPGAFSTWLAGFDRTCRDNALISQARVPLELILRLQQESSSRAPLLLVGFDRLLPVHKALFDAWGPWQESAALAQANNIAFYKAIDGESELTACAAWCMQQLELKPEARLLVLSQDIAGRRGEVERAFLRITKPGGRPLFEFSLGIPLGQVPLVRAAHLLLRWLGGPLTETELDWLFSTELFGAGPEESVDLQTYMRDIRRRSLARPEWTLEAFANQRVESEGRSRKWLRGILEAQRTLGSVRQSPLAWAARVPDLLRAAGIPGERALSSAEYQAWQRWEQALDLCASLGFDGRRIPWKEFLSSLALILNETLFTPESSDAPIQITGPAESAGLDANALWFLGADEQTWPATGSTHPFLPLPLQREFGMPHASARHDWDLAESITKRLLQSAPIVNFSYASQNADAEARPSRLVARFAGLPQPLPADLIGHLPAKQHTVQFADLSRVPFPHGKIRGGSAVLTSQSQCAFKAFATARLGAQGWEPAEFGLSASQRGMLLHAVLHAIWAGPPDGLRSIDDLLALSDLRAFVEEHVRKALRDKLPDGAADRMPRRYLEMEATRVQRLIAEWLAYEATRAPFTVAETESARTIQLASLELDLRLDRIDQLKDGSMLVIDYKTGDVSPKAWELPRPDDVQLPLYAGFALNQQLGGLVFAKIRAGNFEFAGSVTDARATLVSDLQRTSALLKRPLTAEQLSAWKSYIEQLARDFVAGRADVDPGDYPKTCDACGLHAICRIHENRTEPEPEDELEELPFD